MVNYIRYIVYISESLTVTQKKGTKKGASMLKLTIILISNHEGKTAVTDFGLL